MTFVRAIARLLPAITAAVAALVFAAAGQASQLIGRDGTNVQIAVDAKGEALITYDEGGALKRVLAWGAINAVAPSSTAKQVAFQIDYGGGWGKYHTDYWKTFADTCKPYSGPTLSWFVVGCTAPDGSYWAVQAFPQALPDLGYTPWTAAQNAVWLELSHWSGALPELQVWQGWIYGNRYDEIFGKLTYNGQAVHGFGTTQYGVPTDQFGRILYLDTYDAAAYGTGWRRENSFVAHSPSGAFCYGFYPFNPNTGGYQHPPGQSSQRGPGVGTQYRITVPGPGVTPDVMWQGPALGAYAAGATDTQLETSEMTILKSFGDKSCLVGHD
jgi:hypothetical protein